MADSNAIVLAVPIPDGTPPALRRQVLRHAAGAARVLKLRELRKGLGADGKMLARVKPSSRPDGATGPALSPHRPESRSQKWLRVSVGEAAGTVTLWWSHGWGKILGYHARGEVRGAPVRDVISGLAPRNLKEWEAEVGRYAKLVTRPKAKAAAVAKPIATPSKPAPPKVVYLPPGAKRKHAAKTIQVYEEKEKPRPAPKPAPPPAPPPWKPRPMGEFPTLGKGPDQEAWGRRQSEGWADGLSPAEKGAIKIYAANEYKWMNAYLRGDSSQVPEFVSEAGAQAYIDRVAGALARGKTTESVAMYRGVADRRKMGIDPHKLEQGDEVRIDSFASASLNESRARQFATKEGGDHGLLIKINVPAGSTGGYLNAAELSQFELEREFLMPPGTRYRFVRTAGKVFDQLNNSEATVIVLERIE